MLRHGFVDQAYSHIDPPQRMDGTLIPYSYGHGLSFLESPWQAPGHYGKCCTGVKQRSKNVIPDFHDDPEKLVLLFGAAPLLLIGELDIHPCSYEGPGHPGQAPLLGVIFLRGSVIPLGAEGV